MGQFGEVIHCHKPPYSGIPGEDFVNVRFSTQEAADRAYAALKAGQVFIDGFVVGCGPAPKPQGMDALSNIDGPRRRRSPSMNRVANFPSRNDPKSPSPRRLAWEMQLSNRSRSRSHARDRRHRDERNEFSAGPVSLRPERPVRTPSPDPPGPVRNNAPVKNPFFKPQRSPSPELNELLHEMRQDGGPW